MSACHYVKPTSLVQLKMRRPGPAGCPLLSHTVSSGLWSFCCTIFNVHMTIRRYLPSVLWHCWLDDRRFRWRGGDNLTGALHRPIAPVVTITIIILSSSSEVQNGDILVLAYPDYPGKRPLNERRMTVPTWPWLGIYNGSGVVGVSAFLFGRDWVTYTEAVLYV